jgi:hypothetical protein
MWVMGGQAMLGMSRPTLYGDAWYSTDGANWALATSNGFDARSRLSSIVFNEKLWILGGGNYYAFGQAVWYTSNGVTWETIADSLPFLSRIGQTTLVFNNKLWIIAGADQSFGSGLLFSNLYNDVWSSTDGTTWTQVTNSAAFSKRYRHTSVVYDNKMWVIGGNNNPGPWLSTMSNTFNDVWYSTDGNTWTQTTNAAAFSKRYDHTSVVYDNKMWVIGGTDDTKFMGDIWYSSDGITWTLLSPAAGFSPRCRHSSVVFNDKLWVIGGYCSPDGESNDVWYTSVKIK